MVPETESFGLMWGIVCSAPSTLRVDREAEYPSQLKPQMDIKLADGSSKRGVGKMCSGIHNIGLALMRLEQVEKFASGEDIAFTVPDAQNDDLRLRPFFPDWWPTEQS